MSMSHELIHPSNPHLFSMLEKEMKEVCLPWFSSCAPLSYFEFARLYPDGSCYIMATDKRVIEYVLNDNRRVIAPVPDYLVKNRFTYLIPSEGAYSEVMHHASTHFNLRDVFNIFECNEKYIDVFCFGSDNRYYELTNLYLNNKNKFDHLCLELKHHIKCLLKMYHSNKIVLTNDQQINFKYNSTYNQTVSNKANLQIKFTQKEIKCLHGLMMGRTAKETAKSLEISYRTVETHIENIKNKLGCNRKSEVLKQLYQNPDILNLITSDINFFSPMLVQ